MKLRCTRSHGRSAAPSTVRKLVGSIGLVVAVVAASSWWVPVSAQEIAPIVDALERRGWYIEPGAEGREGAFDDLVADAQGAVDTWYFVSMAASVDDDFADELRVQVRPTGNVLVYFIDADDFLNVQLATGESEALETDALVSFDGDWVEPHEFMREVVVDFDRLLSVSGSTTGSTDSGGASGAEGTSAGGGVPGWLVVAVPVTAVGGLVYLNSRRRNEREGQRMREAVTTMHEAISREIDELANDVLVLSDPVDVSEQAEAVEFYREASATYASVSDEIPAFDELEDFGADDLARLHQLGARVSFARWQMDAAEAIVAGEPIPDKPEVAAPPPPPTAPPAPKAAPRPQPQRQPRPRVPYSRSQRGGGGLLDILIAGGSMMGGQRRRGGSPFGVPSRPSRRTGRTGRNGGVFGSGSSPRSTRSRSTSRRRPRASASRSRTSTSRRTGRSTSRSRSRSRRR